MLQFKGGRKLTVADDKLASEAMRIENVAEQDLSRLVGM